MGEGPYVLLAEGLLADLLAAGLQGSATCAGSISCIAMGPLAVMGDTRPICVPVTARLARTRRPVHLHWWRPWLTGHAACSLCGSSDDASSVPRRFSPRIGGTRFIIVVWWRLERASGRQDSVGLFKCFPRPRELAGLRQELGAGFVAGFQWGYLLPMFAP